MEQELNPKPIKKHPDTFIISLVVAVSTFAIYFILAKFLGV